MRYYEIVISPTTSSNTQFKPITISSQLNGKDNYGALDIFLDIFQMDYTNPASNGSIKLFGIDYATLKQDYTYATISISIGMTKGLPLVNTTIPPLQIVKGMITQAYGNWQGKNVTLDIVFVPYFFYATNPPTFNFYWKKGDTLQKAVIDTLNTAFKPTGYQPVITGGFSPALVYTQDVPSLPYSSLFAFSKQINKLSKQINTDSNYPGASIVSTAHGFLLTDGTIADNNSNVTNIKYTDIIGNLTWVNYGELQFKTTMRGDLSIGNYVNLPKGVPIINTLNSYAQIRNNIAYSGNWLINKIHHVGSFRKPDADSWVTVINVIAPVQLQAGFPRATFQ